MEKAFYVSDRLNEYGKIVFAEKRSQAILYSEEVIDNNDYIDCRAIRKPNFDKYAEQGFVPKEELLKDGFWFECHGYKDKGILNQRRCCNACYEENATVIDEKVYCKECAEALNDHPDA